MAARHTTTISPSGVLLLGVLLALSILLPGSRAGAAPGPGVVSVTAAVADSDTGAEAEADTDTGSEPAAAQLTKSTAKRPTQSVAVTAVPEAPGPFPLPEDLPDPARFVVVPLHEEVSLGMAAVVERVAADLGPGDILLLDINTFGGRVDAAVRIRDTLLDLGRKQVVTVAYVHPRAISAGALISLATDIIAVAPGATMGAATPVTIEGGEAKAVGEKTVSYMRKEMRATAEARGRDGDMAEAMVDADIEVPGLSEAGKLLTLDGKQALAWNVASVEADTRDALIAALGYGPEGRGFTVTSTEWSWAEQLAGFLSSAMLSGMLMSIGMLAIMIGLYTGGSPLPLTIGALCLGLFFFGHHVVSLVGIEEVLLFGLGVALIVVEAFTPGLALPGVIGVLLIVASLVMGLIDFEHVPLDVQWQQGWITRALAMVLGSVAVTAALSYAAFRALPETRLGRRFLLEAAITGRAGDQVEAENQAVVGHAGVALSDLRPAGKVRVDDRRLDAVAERGYVPAGARVRVMGLRGFSVVVRQIAEETKEAEAPDRPAGAPADAPAGETPEDETPSSMSKETA